MTTRTIRCDLATSPPVLLDRELRTAVAGMKRTLRGVPSKFRTFAYGVTQSEKRIKPLGQYPDYALAVLRSGAPASDALKPLDELRGWIQSHAAKIGCLATALEAETKEEGEANTAQMRLQRYADKPTMAALDEFIREAEQHREALDQAIQCAYQRKYEAAR